jgi:hypothetical protein
MATTFKTMEIDHGYADALKVIADFGKSCVLVGWPGAGSKIHPPVKRNTPTSKTKPNTSEAKQRITLAEIAFIMEYGSEVNNLPARPIMKKTLARVELDIVRYQGEALSAVLDGRMNIDQALKVLGVWFEGELKRSFTKETFAPLQPATIAAKNSSRPLIDSGQLRQGITSRVVRP